MIQEDVWAKPLVLWHSAIQCYPTQSDILLKVGVNEIGHSLYASCTDEMMS